MKPIQFVTGIFVALLLAFLIPGPGSPDGILFPSVVGPAATFSIFFIQGLQLNDNYLSRILGGWKLHLACLGANFVVAPIVFACIAIMMRPYLSDMSLVYGLVFLGMLPTTINSAISMVSMSDGDVTSAIFNSSLSNILGVLIMPFWFNLWLGILGDVSIQLLPVFIKLGLLILVPVVLGRMIQNRFSSYRWFPSGGILKMANMYLIFLIVYFSFCRSVESGVWNSLGGKSFSMVAFSVLAGMGILHALVWYAGVLMKLDRESMPVLAFCGPQKTIAAGVPLAAAMLSQDFQFIDSGLFLIPLMIYHPAQMIIGGHWIGLLQKRETSGH